MAYLGALGDAPFAGTHKNFCLSLAPRQYLFSLNVAEDTIKSIQSTGKRVAVGALPRTLLQKITLSKTLPSFRPFSPKIAASCGKS